MEESQSTRPGEQDDETRMDRRSERRADSSPPSEVSGPEFYSDVDNASEASFPASDPPAWMGLPPGGPPPPSP